MTTLDDNPPTEVAELRCPTCGARQPWSDTCRRCKCDLTLVHQLRKHLQVLRERCLTQLRDRRLDEALATARRCRALSTEATDAHRLAVCYLLAGSFRAALEIHDTVATGPSWKRPT